MNRDDDDDTDTGDDADLCDGSAVSSSGVATEDDEDGSVDSDFLITSTVLGSRTSTLRSDDLALEPTPLSP